MSIRHLVPAPGSASLVLQDIPDLAVDEDVLAAMLNPFQRACAESYGGGDFAHVQNVEEAREAGDTLFAFLMIELASSEGCDNAGEAVRRLDMAVAEIQGITEAVQRDESPAR